MNKPIAAHACFLFAISLLGACATTPAPGISGRWKPVNHYAAITQEIPLYQTYVFYPSPMDQTLKAMLTRWALDSKMVLRYEHPSDFTLFEPVSRIHTGDLHEAVLQLNALYAPQQVLVTVTSNAIVVRQNKVAEPTPPASVAALPAPDAASRP